MGGYGKERLHGGWDGKERGQRLGGGRRGGTGFDVEEQVLLKAPYTTTLNNISVLSASLHHFLQNFLDTLV